ncbi:serine hydrolase domain-containing protein [Aquimarina litoralis]|uniref:serine hydrolase domain-containing protein n=1 Tax=Aquimarina litoralis TaxID=584605 RepID=UPI001C59B454|nr:serine hydrolase domain-containing protein [Aquimarina litoralis]MBW1298994.1 serine hydrolase [Aquimarina litoralis]
MRKFLILLLITTYVTPIFAQKRSLVATDSLIFNVNNKIPELLQKANVPGMAIAIYDNGELIYKKGYGFADVQNQKSITSSTGFNIGSISKLFTAFGIMKLHEEGKIGLDTPVAHYLTRWKLPETEYNKSKVTIRHLLNHTAGISVHGYPGFIDKKMLPSIESSLDGNNGPQRADEKVKLILEPQTKFQYSGGGYTILQLLIEEVTKMSFENFMDVTIFQPLKMKNTSFVITDEVLENSAIPYDKESEKLPFEYFTAKGAAGLQTTLDDFSKFIDEILHKHSIFSKEIVDIMTTATKVSGNQYGLGFRILRLGPIKLKGHAGSNTGWQSAFFMDFTTKSGLLMLTNGDQGDDVLKRTLRIWASTKYKR